MIFNQLLANSLIAGSIYALVACGFALIYKTNKFMHFAHGVSVAIGAYLLHFFFSRLSVPFYLSCIFTLILASVFGTFMYKFVYEPLQKRKSSKVILLMASVSLMIFFENLILLLFGADVKTIGYIKTSKGLEVLGALITPLQIAIIATSLVLLVLLYLFMKKTKIGRQIRAVSDSKSLSETVGIDSHKIANISFILGSFLAGIAGILIALEQNLEPTMGMNLMIKGFTGAVIGGISSVPASILGSYVLGIAENFGIWYLPSGYKDAIAFVLLFVFLLFKPTGLLGINKGVKE